MKLQKIYRLAVELGKTNDLRGAIIVQRHLTRAKNIYDKLSTEEQKTFDQDKLWNPYLDSRIFGEPEAEVSQALVGIDFDTSEALLADRLNQKGKHIDLLLFHHPVGRALAEGLQDVMKLQVELMNIYGVPLNVAENLIHLRRSEVDRNTSAGNYYKALDAAQLLGFPVMCAHTIADNMVANFLFQQVKKEAKKLETVGDILDLLKKIPEYQAAAEHGMGPTILVGVPDRYAGKIAVTEITGGTEGSKHMYEKLAAAGVGTIIGMHLAESHREEAEKAHLNVIIAGHMSSDSLGMNLFCDELEQQGVQIIPCSGFLRHRRKALKRAIKGRKK